MPDSTHFFLECEDKGKDVGLTAVSDKLQELIQDFANWMNDNGLLPEDIAYARIYRCSDLGCVGRLILEDGMVVLQPLRVRGGALGARIRWAIFNLKFAWHRLCYTFRYEIIRSDIIEPEDEEEEGDDE